jgi:hypothetical protein
LEYVDPVRSLRADWAVVVDRLPARSRLQAIPIDAPAARVMTVRDGKLACSEAYGSVPEALKPAGLE